MSDDIFDLGVNFIFEMAFVRKIGLGAKKANFPI
jgi:hypothetical protein